MHFNPQLFKVSIIQTKLFGPLDFELSRFHGIVIPGLSQFCGSDTDDRLLCTVRAVRAYLARVKSKRSGRKRLFLPLKGSKDISPFIISRWICDVIKLAYADLPSSDLSFMKISAHEVRALSLSWAYWNLVALDDVV